MPTTAQARYSPSLTTVFNKLLAEIVSGKYAAGSRLPAERELAHSLGASRPTLREALRQLGERGLLEPRRGSGIVIKSAREWSLNVLPIFVRLVTAHKGQQALRETIGDLLEVRRAMFLPVIKLAATRISKGSLEQARKALREAWAAKDDFKTFASKDIDVLRSILEAAHMLPALWMLNDLAGIYYDFAQMLSGIAIVPSNYLEIYTQIFAALEQRDPETATRLMSAYLTMHDERLLALLGGVV